MPSCRYLNLLRDAFNGSGSGRGLHFSFDTNITQTQQRAARVAADPGAAAKSLHATAETRFFWNQTLLQPLIGALEASFTASALCDPLINLTRDAVQIASAQPVWYHGA